MRRTVSSAMAWRSAMVRASRALCTSFTASRQRHEQVETQQIPTSLDGHKLHKRAQSRRGRSGHHKLEPPCSLMREVNGSDKAWAQCDMGHSGATFAFRPPPAIAKDNRRLSMTDSHAQGGGCRHAAAAAPRHRVRTRWSTRHALHRLWRSSSRRLKLAARSMILRSLCAALRRPLAASLSCHGCYRRAPLLTARARASTSTNASLRLAKDPRRERVRAQARRLRHADRARLGTASQHAL